MIIITGIAGSGKSMHGQALAETIGYRWLSIGELLRQHITGEERESMLAGKMIDDDRAIAILSQTLFDSNTIKETIIDGFPRTSYQAEWLLHQVQDGKLAIEAIFHLTVLPEEAKARLLSRGRPDDQEEAIQQRFREYQNTIIPIIKQFKTEGIPVFEVHTEPPFNVVQDEMIRAFQSL